MLKIVLPSTSWSGRDLEQIYKAANAPGLYFQYKRALHDQIQQNEERGTLWAAYWDGRLVGVASLVGRREYSHLGRHGEVHVLKEFRRQRIATALYCAHAMQLVLEGRREVEDTIIPEYSPGMIGPTEAGGQGFLPSLGYRQVGFLPERTSGFQSVCIWIHEPYDLQAYLSRLRGEVWIELRMSYKVRATWQQNMELYRRHRPALIERFEAAREVIASCGIARVVASHGT